MYLYFTQHSKKQINKQTYFIKMGSTKLKENINSLDARFSMRMFISDLPRVLNEAFMVVKNVFNSFYDAEKDEISTTTINVGTLKSSTIITNNIAIKDSSSGKTINYEELYEIKERLSKIENILGIDGN